MRGLLFIGAFVLDRRNEGSGVLDGSGRLVRLAARILFVIGALFYGLIALPLVHDMLAIANDTQLWTTERVAIAGPQCLLFASVVFAPAALTHIVCEAFASETDL